MVDKVRRQKLALHLRHLSVGLITNDDFEERIYEDVSFGSLPEHYHSEKDIINEDQIIKPMLELSWCLYSDLEEHKLKGRHELSKEHLKDIARCILFLLSDLEYEWPYIDIKNPLFGLSFKELILSILTLGQYFRNKKKDIEKEYEQIKLLGDFDVWPFFSLKDYEAQLLLQPFLNGQMKGSVIDKPSI